MQSVRIVPSAIERSPREAELYYKRAMLRARGPQMRAAAEDDARMALELDPDHPRAREILAGPPDGEQ